MQNLYTNFMRKSSTIIMDNMISISEGNHNYMQDCLNVYDIFSNERPIVYLEFKNSKFPRKKSAQSKSNITIQ